MLTRLVKRFQHHRQAGSVIMAVMAVAVLGFLLLVGFSISQLRITQASQTLDDALTLKLSMVAESGINEAVATRLFPASNRYSFGFTSEAQARATMPAHPETRPKPFFYSSSYVFERPTGGAEELLGRYQYVILGANPFIALTGNTFDVSQALAERGAFLYNIDYTLYVASKATVCTDAQNQVMYDAITVANNEPQCTAGNVTHTRTVLARLEPIATAADPTENAFQIVATKLIESDVDEVLETPIMNRNGASIDTLNFDAWWNNEAPHRSAQGMAVPLAYRYATRDPVTQQAGNYVYALWPTGVTTLNFGGANYMPFIEVFFRGGIDERSLYVGNGRFRFDRSIDMLDTAPGYPDIEGAYSGVVLRNAGGGYAQGHVELFTAYPGASMLRVTGYAQCDDASRLVINDKGQLRDSEGFQNTQRYTIQFTNACASLNKWNQIE